MEFTVFRSATYFVPQLYIRAWDGGELNVMGVTDGQLGRRYRLTNYCRCSPSTQLLAPSHHTHDLQTALLTKEVGQHLLKPTEVCQHILKPKEV